MPLIFLHRKWLSYGAFYLNLSLVKNHQVRGIINGYGVRSKLLICGIETGKGRIARSTLFFARILEIPLYMESIEGIEI